MCIMIVEVKRDGPEREREHYDWLYRTADRVSDRGPIVLFHLWSHPEPRRGHSGPGRRAGVTLRWVPAWSRGQLTVRISYMIPMNVTTRMPLTTPVENLTNYNPAWRSSGGQPDHEQLHTKSTPETGQEDQSPALLEGPLVKDHSPLKTYDVRECQLILHLSKGKTLQFIRQYILPIPGAVALVGRKYLVHQWALNHALQLRSVSPRPLNLEQSSRARKHLKRRGQSPLTSSEMPSTSSGEKSST